MPSVPTHMIMIVDLFDVFLNLACKYIIENFCINVHTRDWSVIFFGESLYGLRIRITVASSKELDNVFLCFYSVK